jgi:hypothetical protein
VISHGILTAVGDRNIRFQSALVYYVSALVLTIGLIIVLTAFATRAYAVGVFAVAFVGFIAFLVWRTPYEATLRADNQVVFRSHGRKQCFDVEDLRSIERKTGENGDYWVFSFIDGSSHLEGDAGRELAEVLCELNPRVVALQDPGRVPGTRTFFQVRRAKAEPEWVRRGEKKSAQDLARQDREASRRLAGKSRSAAKRGRLQ